MLGLGNIKSPLTGGDMEDPITTQDMVIAPSVRETASEDGAVLLDIEQGICFSLNPVGLRIWELLKKRHSVDQIADALAQDFPVSRSQLLSDVVEFLQSLEAKRLIHRADHTVAKQSWLTRSFPVGKGTRTTPLEHTSGDSSCGTLGEDHRGPHVDNSTDNGRRARHLENHHRPSRSRMGHDKQRVLDEMAPRATVAFLVPHKVDRSFLYGFPVTHLYRVMRFVDHNHGAAWDQVVHCVVIQGNDAQSKLASIQPLAHNCRHSKFFCALRHQPRFIEADVALKCEGKRPIRVSEGPLFCSLVGLCRALRHVLGIFQSHAEGLQDRGIGYLVAFAKALGLKNVRHGLAIFHVGESPTSNPIALIVGAARDLAGEALDRHPREVKFFPKSSKPFPRARHDYYSGRRADSVLEVCTC